MDALTIRGWLHESAASISLERERLTALDAAIGDGDHGVNLTRGFDAVLLALDREPSAPPGPLLVLAGRTLVSTVGGASGPLWGSALRRAGRSLGDAERFELRDLAEALAAALAGITELGGAAAGDKTMVDALGPAVDSLREDARDGRALADALQRAAAAAERGAEATVAMQARKGRASYLGERSIGHQDPGATSTALILRALQHAASSA
jgi:dihydroxyacetone kinase-like protein